MQSVSNKNSKKKVNYSTIIIWYMNNKIKSDLNKSFNQFCQRRNINGIYGFNKI